jgi:hypothetical protein
VIHEEDSPEVPLHIYYDLCGQAIEERTDVSASNAGTVYRHYVLSPADGSIIFSEKPGVDGASATQIYPIKDDKGSVRALVAAGVNATTGVYTADVTETFNYTPYGAMTSNTAGAGYAEICSLKALVHFVNRGLKSARHSDFIS